MFYDVIVIVILLYVQNLDGIPWPLETATGCYGNTQDDFLIPSCNTSYVMAVSGVFAMAKERNTHCPEIALPDDRNEEKCCRVAPEDCKMIYTASDMTFHSECIGLETCKKKVAWAVTTCNTTIFLDKSNYMMMEFYCIARSLILNVSDTEAGTTKGSAVYVQNQGYPSSSEIRGSCSVSSSCNTTIVVTAIHLSLNVNNSCSQHLDITDGSVNQIIDCSQNNGGDFAFKDVYTSIGHFLFFEFTTLVPGDKGKLWIEVRGSNPHSIMDLRCGSSAVSTPPPVDECPVYTTRTLSTTSNPASTTTALSHMLSTSERTFASIPGKPMQNWQIGLLVTGVLALIGFVALLTCFFLKKKRANKVDLATVTDRKDIDGLPTYLYGPEPEITKQTAPVQGLLISIYSQWSPRQTENMRASSNDRVPKDLWRFDDPRIQNKPSGGRTILPAVRVAGQPTVPVLHSVLPLSTAAALNSHVVNDTVAGDVEQGDHMQPERKSKKKKRKKDKINEDDCSATEGETRKKKKKKKKKSATDHVADEEL